MRLRMSDLILKTLRFWLYGGIALGAWNAQALEPIIYEGVDISPIVEYFGKQVVTLNKPVFVYNWSPSGAKNVGLGHFSKAQRSAESYWKNFGGDDGGNVFGKGLYAAIDPLYSANYGASSPDKTDSILETALLLQMQLPKGFRFVDLVRTDKPTRKMISQDLKELITGFGCIESQILDTYSPSYLGTFLANGGNPQPKSCQKLIIKVLKDVLQIDGFSYDYDSTDFRACRRSGPYRSRAFVITRSKWMRPELIRHYNHNSKHDFENRKIIQTLFLIQNNANPGGIYSISKKSMSLVQDQISVYLNLHSYSEIQGESNTCDGEICTLTVRFCDTSYGSLQCENVGFDHPFHPEDGLILAKDVENTIYEGLLWSDLEGHPIPKDIDTWIVENLFGCSNETPYEESL